MQMQLQPLAVQPKVSDQQLGVFDRHKSINLTQPT